MYFSVSKCNNKSFCSFGTRWFKNDKKERIQQCKKNSQKRKEMCKGLAPPPCLPTVPMWPSCAENSLSKVHQTAVFLCSWASQCFMAFCECLPRVFRTSAQVPCTSARSEDTNRWVSWVRFDELGGLARRMSGLGESTEHTRVISIPSPALPNQQKATEQQPAGQLCPVPGTGTPFRSARRSQRGSRPAVRPRTRHGHTGGTPHRFRPSLR